MNSQKIENILNDIIGIVKNEYSKNHQRWYSPISKFIISNRSLKENRKIYVENVFKQWEFLEKIRDNKDIIKSICDNIKGGL
jgi:hypothetical protein